MRENWGTVTEWNGKARKFAEMKSYIFILAIPLTSINLRADFFFFNFTFIAFTILIIHKCYAIDGIFIYDFIFSLNLSITIAYGVHMIATSNMLIESSDILVQYVYCILSECAFTAACDRLIVLVSQVQNKISHIKWITFVMSTICFLLIFAMKSLDFALAHLHAVILIRIDVIYITLISIAFYFVLYEF